MWRLQLRSLNVELIVERLDCLGVRGTRYAPIEVWRLQVIRDAHVAVGQVAYVSLSLLLGVPRLFESGI